MTHRLNDNDTGLEELLKLTDLATLALWMKFVQLFEQSNSTVGKCDYREIVKIPGNYSDFVCVQFIQ